MYSNLAGGYYQNVMNYTQLSNDAYAVNTYNAIYTMIAKANTVINTDMTKIEGTRFGPKKCCICSRTGLWFKSNRFLMLLDYMVKIYP